MFGDMGHGFLLFCAALYLFTQKKSLRKSGNEGAIGARYLLLIMSFFAMFTGSLYNEFFSFPFNVFGSCFDEVVPPGEPGEPPLPAVAERINTCVYPWGFDPIWFKSSNDLLFINSFKMKWAVIVGVSSMVFGILMKAANSCYFREWLTFFFSIVTCSIWIYLSFLIKFLQYFSFTAVNLLLLFPLSFVFIIKLFIIFIIHCQYYLIISLSSSSFSFCFLFNLFHLLQLAFLLKLDNLSYIVTHFC